MKDVTIHQVNVSKFAGSSKDLLGFLYSDLEVAGETSNQF